MSKNRSPGEGGGRTPARAPDRSAIAIGEQQLVARPPVAPTLELDPCLLVDADERSALVPSIVGCDRQRQIAERLERRRSRGRTVPGAGGPRSRRRGSGGRRRVVGRRTRRPTGTRRSARPAPGRWRPADRWRRSRRSWSRGSVAWRRGSRPCSRRRGGARRPGHCRPARRASTPAGRPGSVPAGRCTSRSGGWHWPSRGERAWCPPPRSDTRRTVRARRIVDAEQEVRVPAPRAVEERRLVDDVVRRLPSPRQSRRPRPGAGRPGPRSSHRAGS